VSTGMVAAWVQAARIANVKQMVRILSLPLAYRYLLFLRQAGRVVSPGGEADHPIAGSVSMVLFRP